MGMSASQARLLSITARLTNNELSSQLMTNSKIRLASKSEEASNEYMNSLNATKLQYNYYNDNGEAEAYDLTPQFLYTYQPLKNQYSIQNSNGVNLVNVTDAENFEKTNNLYDFLDCYGLIDQDNLNEYKEAMEIYEADKSQYSYFQFRNIVGTNDCPNVICYDEALNGDNPECYLHVLNELLDFDGVSLTNHTYTTTTNNLVTTNAQEGSLGILPMLKDVSDVLESKFCDGNDNDYLYTEDNLNLLESKHTNGEKISDFDRLRSDYIENADGSYSLKNLKQKAIDLYYIIMNAGVLNVEDATLRNLIISFTDGDMKRLAGADTDMSSIPQCPKEPTEPVYEPKITDKNKGQWYTNLWYMMNGSDTANLVKEDNDETTSDRFVVSGTSKNKNTLNYNVLDDSKLSDSSWLQYALKNGIVTIKQAIYFDPSKDSGKVPELVSDAITWKSTIYSTAVDIVEVDDKAEITRAQAKYEKATKEIEAKDNDYDIKLKNLDTIHSALQTEYESVKSVITKNLERSFKAFS